MDHGITPNRKGEASYVKLLHLEGKQSGDRRANPHPRMLTRSDEDIVGSNMTMPTTSILKVQPFYMRLIIDAFDELVLHHKMCIFLFSELLTWIKGRFDCIWKAWKVNEVDWGPNPSIPNVLHLDTTSLLVQGKKEIKSNTFWGWIRTPGQLQLVMFTTVAYGLGLGRSSTLWNPYEVYFHMDLESCP